VKLAVVADGGAPSSKRSGLGRGLAEIAQPAWDPHRGVNVFADYKGDIRAACDVLVIGSGPGGSVVAKELAEAGKDVILLEEGPPFGVRDFRQESGEAFHRTLREGGMRATRGSVFLPTMQAIALGGGSLINSAICARSPDWVFEKWAARTGTDSITGARLRPHYERVERVLGVEPTPEPVQGPRNLLFKKGCDALGISSEPTRRNARGCKGSAECFTGCRNGAKQSTDVSYLPLAMRSGARVLSSVRAEQVVMNGHRAEGIRGHVVEPFTGKTTHAVDIAAKVVVLAAGCMATPLLLMRSGIGASSGYVGRELQLHPGLAIMAIFPDPIDPWKGATQGYHSLHYLEQGMKLEVLWSPPAVLAARFPGFGHDFQRHLTTYNRMAPFDVIIAADRSRGVVRPKRGGLLPDIRFDLVDADVELLQRGLGILSDICWAAGAVAVLPGLFGVPDLLHSKEEAEVLRTKRLRAQDMISAANHAFGTTRMAKRPEDGVVDERGRCHDTENVFIADTGIFPGSPAVNPMLTCMALADLVASEIAAHG
jgi:choline dehydrogenase-like flavoprotein